MAPLTFAAKAFDRAAARARVELHAHDLIPESGVWHEAAALKVYRRHWRMKSRADAGLFFSVWIDEKTLKRGHVLYNIHALKLRSLSSYALQSREFAEAFRKRFQRFTSEWPNVSTDFGPQTLMQGFIPLDNSALDQELDALIRRFIPLANIIDALLGERSPSSIAAKPQPRSISKPSRRR